MKTRSQNKNRHNTKVGIAYSAIIIAGAFTLFILFFVIMITFWGTGEYQKNYGIVSNGGAGENYAEFRLLPEAFSLEQYKNTVWENSDFWFYFWNSCGISIPIAIGITIVGGLGGYAFAIYHFRASKFILYLFILLMMVPYQVLLAPQFRLLFDLNLINHSLSVVLPNIFAPFGVFLVYQYASKIPQEQIEAARVDGAGEIYIFFKVALPQLVNGLISLFLLNMIDTWNMIEQPLVFLGEEFRFPLSVALNQSGNGDALQGFVGCLLYIIPLFILFMLGYDKLIDGISNSIV